MPFVNYCRKCKAETPLAESCPYCGGKLAKTNEQLSFGAVRIPVRDWFAWNQILRVCLPAWALVVVLAICTEAAANGTNGVIRLLSQGFLTVMLFVLLFMLALVLVLLLLQGPERVHYVLSKQGVHVRVYLPDASPVRLYAHFVTPEGVAKLTDAERPPLDGLTLVRHTYLPWASVKRVRIWREGFTLLFFRPAYWQAAAVRCPVNELSQAEEFVRARLKRFKKVRVLPKTTQK